MTQYRPFGKAGGGAPIYPNHHRRQKFTEYDLPAGNPAPPPLEESEDEEVF